jgi:hypothetical protein
MSVVESGIEAVSLEIIGVEDITGTVAVSGVEDITGTGEVSGVEDGTDAVRLLLLVLHPTTASRMAKKIDTSNTCRLFKVSSVSHSIEVDINNYSRSSAFPWWISGGRLSI